MNLIFVVIVMINVVVVRSECDSYLSCVGSFFGEFFNQKDKLPPLDSVVAKNSKLDNVGVNEKELDQILLDVSGFLKEELEVHPDVDLKTMVFRNILNETAIYIKTFDIPADYFEDSDEDETEDYKSRPFEVPETANISLVESMSRIDNTEITEVTPKITSHVDKVATITNTNTLTQNITKDVRENEIEKQDDSYLYYDNNDDNATDYPIIDYIEYYKDTTNEYVNLEVTESPLSIEEMKENINSAINASLHKTIINLAPENITKDYGYGGAYKLSVVNFFTLTPDRNTTSTEKIRQEIQKASNIDEDLRSSVFPWIAAIFLKNSTSDQFNYYCDGALLTNRTVITAASCVHTSNTENLLLLIGKKSLMTMTEAEKVARVKTIKIHGNFSAPTRANDLAILILEESIIFTDNIQAATLNKEELKENLATTGWAVTGDLTAILLKTGANLTCDETQEDRVCAVYGNDVTVCPSYGGLYVTKQEAWSLQGLRTADPEDRGLCINRNIAFTLFNKHWEWIKDSMQ